MYNNMMLHVLLVNVCFCFFVVVFAGFGRMYSRHEEPAQPVPQRSYALYDGSLQIQ